MWWALGHGEHPGVLLWPLSLLLAVNVTLVVQALVTDAQAPMPGSGWRLLVTGLAVLLLSQAGGWWLNLHVQAAVLLPVAVWAGWRLGRLEARSSGSPVA